MNRVFPKKVYYEIAEKLGEGLTSEVYKAFRVDQKAWTRQVVALKIIKSKKHVQVLKKEFEKLNQVQSKYCIQVKAWENLPQGSSLVLEYVAGTTLLDLWRQGLLTEELTTEILIQVRMGLRALHRKNVFHGDLNLKNILISHLGVVKLIDFGFFSPNQGSLVTPRFASPELLRGGSPSEGTDFFSFKKIQNDLSVNFSGSFQLSSRGSSQASRRRKLAKAVFLATKQNSQETQTVRFTKTKTRVWKKLALKHCLFILVFFMTLLGEVRRQSIFYGRFQVLSEKWLEFSLNGLPAVYAPYQSSNLRAGDYQIQWKTSQGQGHKSFHLKKGKTFLLKP